VAEGKEPGNGCLVGKEKRDPRGQAGLWATLARMIKANPGNQSETKRGRGRKGSDCRGPKDEKKRHPIEPLRSGGGIDFIEGRGAKSKALYTSSGGGTCRGGKKFSLRLRFIGEWGGKFKRARN